MEMVRITLPLGRKIIFIAAFMAELLLVLSCGSLKGEFGFKTFLDDTYRKWPDPLEFDSGKEIQWVYQFSADVDRRRIGVLYQKKEILWVEVETSANRVDSQNPNVFGVIKNLPAGDYKIILIDMDNDNRYIDERAFTVYTDEDVEE